MKDRSVVEPRVEEPAWVRFWRANPGGRTVEHVETKGKRKRARRERKAKR